MTSAKIAIGVVAFGGLVCSTASAGTPGCIDDFMTGAFSDTQTLVGNYYDQQAGGMLGGERDLRYAVVSNTFGLTSDVIIGNGMTFNANDPGVRGTVALDYDGSGDTEVDGNADFELGSGLNEDWSAAPSVDIDFLFLDLDFEVRMVLQTFDGGGAVLGESVLEQMVSSSNAPFTENFLFGDFATTVGTGVDLTDVDRLTIYFNNQEVSAVDFGISKIYVPTPGSLGLLAMGGMVAIRRRR